MMQWKKGGGPNCAIENLAKCNNPRDLPHNSDLIKCNWDLAMSLQCPSPSNKSCGELFVLKQYLIFWLVWQFKVMAAFRNI